MPKKSLIKDRFEGGLVNDLDSRDIDETGLANATNVMCDVVGRVRQMGRDTPHATLTGTLAGALEPGYGLFPFNADHDVSNDSAVETKLLAIQNQQNISIYDSAVNANEIVLGTDTANVQPAFYFIDGCLRVADGNFSHTTNYVPKSYQFIERTLFSASATNLGTDHQIVHTADWNKGADGQGLDALIYPPLNTGADTGALLTSSGITAFPATVPGNLSIRCTVTEDIGEWAQDAALKFGLSYLYDGDQESQITDFTHTFDAAAAATNDDYALNVDLQIDTGEAEDAFDPRIIGCNLYWTGDSGGDFEDPLFLGKFHWGSSTTDLPYFETHAGDRDSTMVDSDTGEAATGLVSIPTLPALTYALLNPDQNNKSETTAANFKHAITINRRTYIGNIQRIKFKTSTIGSLGNQAQYRQPQTSTIAPNADRMIKSPVNRFDIFPIENLIDVAVDDGDSINALVGYSDRILQFKKNTLYVINVSGDYEYLEMEKKYMGVSKPYQVVETEYGVVWVNKNGCYIYDGEQILNLITTKLDPSKPLPTLSEDPDSAEGWSAFIGATGMAGYIPNMKQLVIFEDPGNPGASGNVMIYDFKTQSWTRGLNRTSSTPKSNIAVNYDDTCLYTTQSINDVEQLTVQKTVESGVGEDGIWVINGLDGELTTTTGAATSCQLVLGEEGTLDNLLTAARQAFLADTLEDDDNEFDFGGNNGDGTTTLIDASGTDGFIASNATFAVVSAAGKLINTASAQGAVSIALTTVVGNIYDVEFDTGAQNSTIEVSISTSTTFNGSNTSGAVTASQINANLGTRFTATATTSYLVIRLSSSTNTEYANIDNLKVWEGINITEPFVYNPAQSPPLSFKDTLTEEIQAKVGNDLEIIDAGGEYKIVRPFSLITSTDEYNGKILTWKNNDGPTSTANFTYGEYSFTPASAIWTTINMTSADEEYYNIPIGTGTKVELHWIKNTTDDLLSYDVLSFAGGMHIGLIDDPVLLDTDDNAGNYEPQIKVTGGTQNPIILDLWDSTSIQAQPAFGGSLEASFHGGTHYSITMQYADTVYDNGTHGVHSGRSALATQTPAVFDPTITLSRGFFLRYGDVFHLRVLGDISNDITGDNTYTFTTGNSTLNAALNNGLRFSSIDVEYKVTTLKAYKYEQSTAMQGTWDDLFSFATPLGTNLVITSAGSVGVIDSPIHGGASIPSEFLIRPYRNNETAASVRYYLGISGQDGRPYNVIDVTSANDTDMNIADGLDTALQTARTNVSDTDIPWATEEIVSATTTSDIVVSVSQTTLRWPGEDLTALGLGENDVFQMIGDTDANASWATEVYKVKTIEYSAPNTTIVIASTAAEGADGTYIETALALADGTHAVKTGAHSAGTSITVLTDAGESWSLGEFIYTTINNTTDGSSGTITGNGTNTISVSALTGGTDNDWDTSDAYSISYMIRFAIVKVVENTPSSNYPVLDINGIVTDALQVKEFKNDLVTSLNDSSGSGEIIVETPDFTFEDLSTDKSIYSVSMTVKAAGRFRVMGAANGSERFDYEFLTIPLTAMQNLTPANWKTLKLYNNGQKTPIKGVKSFRIKIKPIDGTSVSGFQLNDLSITYRGKPPR